MAELKIASRAAKDQAMRDSLDEAFPRATLCMSCKQRQERR